MQVAHGIDLEDIGEDGHHEHVRDETKAIVFEVGEEVEVALAVSRSRVVVAGVDGELEHTV